MKKYRIYLIIAIITLALCITVCFIPIGASKFIPVVEKQFQDELGVKVHIEKLIFRLGPALKIKAPLMHVMYEDNKKFAQLNNVKFYVNWSAVLKNDIKVNKIYADRFIVDVSSKDKFLSSLMEKINSKDFEEYPNLQLKNYSIKYKTDENNKKYEIKGANLDIIKLKNYKNLKVVTDGEFYINDKRHISYNLSLAPYFELDKEAANKFNLQEFIDQIENLDFYSDIFANLKLYNNKEKNIQISGTLNLDKILVLDLEKKNPKSFIYLTFLGNKVGVQSNIYTSSDKKVDLAGIIDNSKKPEIDLTVKTDEIMLADLYKKIKLLIDCSKYKGIELMSGKLKADFNLKGDINKLKSTGYLKISDAAVKSSGIKMQNINSDIDFSNNSINISNAVGYINNAPIMIKGKIKKEIDLQLLMDKVELKHILPSNIGIANGLISLDAKLTGTLENIIHKENVRIEKFRIDKDKNSISFDALNLDTNKDNVALISNINIKPKFAENIKIPTLKLLVDGDKISIKNTNIYMPNSKLQANAEISDFSSRNTLFNLNINGSINSKDINYTKNLSSVFPIKIHIFGNKESQNLDSQVQIINSLVLDEPSSINFSGKLEKNNLKIEDLSISSLNEKTSSSTKYNKGTKKLIISGNIENIFKPVMKNIRVFIPQQLNLNINDTIAQIKGDVFINGEVKQPELVGQLTISNIINQFLQLSVSNAIIDFNKNVAILNAPIVKIADSSASINATISTNFSNSIVVKNAGIKSKFLNTDTMLGFKNNPFIDKHSVKIQEGKFYAERASVSIYNNIINLSALNADFDLNNNTLNINNLSADLYNGKMAGALNYNLINDNFESTIQARGASASPIFNVISSKKEQFTGSMDFDTTIKGNLNSKQSINGNIKFIVHNGHMGTLGKLEHLLYAQNVIADNMLRTSLSGITKAVTLKDTGLFKYLRGDIEMKDGIANINFLQSQGPYMAMFIKGLYNPETDYAKFNILGRISDEVIESLGAFGDFSFNKLMVMLTGEENNLNVQTEDIDKLPQLQTRNTKEFKALINGILEKPSSVIQFNWISYTKKSLKQKEQPPANTKLPDFLEALPY